MRKILTLTMCLMFAGAVVGSTEVELPKSTSEIGTELSYIKYEEPGVMEDTGMMSGITGSYTYHNKLMLKLEGKISYGQVDYDGQLSDGTPYKVKDINDLMLEARGLIGYDFLLMTTDDSATYVTPYTGFGYRYLYDAMGKAAAGYDRESNYFYSPIGAELIYKFDNGWSFGGSLEYDLFWHGLQRSHLEDLASGLSTLDNDQKKGWGIRGTVKVQKDWKKIRLVVEPFVRYWNIGKSDESSITYKNVHVGTGYEPKNNSVEVGGKIAFIF